MSSSVLLVVHIITSVILILIILLQIGKGASLSNLFGGGSSDAVFSGAGGDVFMKKLTIGFAVVFVLTSLGLTVISSKGSSRTVMDKVPQTALPVVGVGQEQKSVPEDQGVPVPTEEKVEEKEPFNVD